MEKVPKRFTWLKAAAEVVWVIIGAPLAIMFIAFSMHVSDCLVLASLMGLMTWAAVLVWINLRYAIDGERSKECSGPVSLRSGILFFAAVIVFTYALMRDELGDREGAIVIGVIVILLILFARSRCLQVKRIRRGAPRKSADEHRHIG